MTKNARISAITGGVTLLEEVTDMPGSLARLLDIPFRWHAKNSPEVTLPDCIIVQAFGQEVLGSPPDNVIAPGPCNEALARALSFYNADRAIPIISQWELADTVAAKRGTIVVNHEVGRNSGYLDTLQIIREASEIMRDNGWESAAIAAHPLHLVRCIWIAKKLGVKVTEPEHLVFSLERFANVWNIGVEVPERQWQTTSKTKWIFYELLARCLFWLKGWI